MPPKLTISPASSFACRCTAGYKNPYSIFFPGQTERGHSRLTAKEIEMQFTDHWDMALMDYNGSLEDANELVTIHLWDPCSLREDSEQVFAWSLFSYEKTRWKSRREWFDYMASCRE